MKIYFKPYSFLATIVLLSMLLPQGFSKTETLLPKVLRDINEDFSGGNRTGRPIVVVHGFGDHYQDISSFLKRLSHATQHKRPIYSAPYLESIKSFPFFSLQTLSKRLGKFVQVLLKNERIHDKTGFDMVGISLGGLVARIYIQNSMKYQHPFVRNFVTMGSPHHGMDIHALRSVNHAKAQYTKTKEKIKRVAWKAAVMMSEKFSPFVGSIAWGNKDIVPVNRTLERLDSISTLVFKKDRLVTPSSTQRIQINGEFSCSVECDHLDYSSYGLPSFESFLNYALAETEEERAKRQTLNEGYMILGDMDCTHLGASGDEH